jgi:hypothetical protein
MPKRARTENVGEHDDALAPLSTKQRKQLKRVVEHEMGEANIAFALGDLDASMKYVHSVSSVGTLPVGPLPVEFVLSVLAVWELATDPIARRSCDVPLIQLRCHADHGEGPLSRPCIPPCRPHFQRAWAEG